MPWPCGRFAGAICRPPFKHLENAIALELLLIIGASARAAAWSALRSGRFSPWCIDLFADADLQRACPAQAIPASAYPGGFLEVVREAPPGPWCYTGGLENHPNLIEAMARQRPLCGNPAEVVRQARSPQRVADVLRHASLPCPALAARIPSGQGVNWLIKPRRSAGGKSIRPWRGVHIPRGCYAQELIDGESCSALFTGTRDGSSLFLGATRQLIGISWLHAGSFRYCGNVGPLRLTASLRAQLELLGRVLTEAFSLRGLFGVDFILKDEVVWPIEVNPRYTAGVEILERASGSSLFSYHAKAFERPGRLPIEEMPPPSPQSAIRNPQSAIVHGKAILFARGPLVFPSEGPWQDSLRKEWSEATAPDFADIPHPQTQIARGQPILTVFAHAANEAACLKSLRAKAQALDQWLFGS